MKIVNQIYLEFIQLENELDMLDELHLQLLIDLLFEKKL
jgi:hypothetical protein